MNVVISYSHKDFNVAFLAAKTLCTKTKFDGSNLYLYGSQHAPEPPQELQTYGVSYIKCGSDTKDYPSGPNIMFATLMSHIAKGKLGDLVFCTEPDGFPTCVDWYDKLKAAHERTGAPASGTWVGWTVPPEWPNAVPHFNGNMIWSRWLVQQLPMICRPVMSSWDLHHAEIITNNCAHNLELHNPHRTQTYYPIEWWMGHKQAWIHGADGFQVWEHISSHWEDVISEPSKKVYTYYEKPDAIDSYQKLLNLWSKRWREAGFQPIVLNRGHAECEELDILLNRIKELPTVNDPQYEAACYIRWMALRNQGGGLMVDIDVLPYRMEEWTEPDEDVLCYEQSNVPCMVWSNVKGCNGIMETFMQEAPIVNMKGKNHTSDMYFFRKYVDKRELTVCAEIESETEDTLAIHFAQSACRRIFNKSKHDSIKEISEYKPKGKKFIDLAVTEGEKGREDTQGVLHDFVGKMFHKTDIVDVGSGLGKSRERLSVNGNTVRLYEPGPGCPSDLDSLADVWCDLITMFDVIEHVKYSKSFVRDLSKKCSYIAISTPNRLRLEKKYNPHHYHEYSPNELVELLGEQNIVKIFCWTGQWETMDVDTFLTHQNIGQMLVVAKT